MHPPFLNSAEDPCGRARVYWNDQSSYLLKFNGLLLRGQNFRNLQIHQHSQACCQPMALDGLEDSRCAKMIKLRPLCGCKTLPSAELGRRKDVEQEAGIHTESKLIRCGWSAGCRNCAQKDASLWQHRE